MTTRREAIPVDGISEDIARSLNIAIELKKQTIDRFSSRRQLEWRVSFAFWAAFAVIANAGRDLDPSTGEVVLMLVGVITFALLHAAWALGYVARAAVRNRDQGLDLEDTIRHHLGLPFIERKVYRRSIAHVWPAVITLLLGLGAVFVVTA